MKSLPADIDGNKLLVYMLSCGWSVSVRNDNCTSQPVIAFPGRIGRMGPCITTLPCDESGLTLSDSIMYALEFILYDVFGARLYAKTIEETK